MNLSKNKCIILGMMTLFLLTAANPIFTDGLVTIASADPICSISAPNEVWGGETFEVTALVDNKACNFANINFNGESSGDQNPYEFTAPAVTEETIMQITVYFSEIDPNIQKTTDIKIKPNALEVGDYHTTDASTFHVFVQDKIGNPVCGVSVYVSWGEEHTTGFDGKTRLPFTGVPPIPEGEGDKTYTLSVTKAGYESDYATVFVKNDNIAPMAPQIGGPIIAFVGENNPNDYTFSGIDPDYFGNDNDYNGVDVKYEYKWALSDSWTSTGYDKSGHSVTISNYWDEPGEYTICAKTIDEHGAESGISTKMVTVLNFLPEAPTLSGNRYYSDEESASFTATSEDNENHDIMYEFEATGLNGGVVIYKSGWVTSGAGCPATLGLTNGIIYNVRARATDPWKHEKGDWSDWSNTIRVVKGNIAPDTPGKPSVIEKDGTIRKFSAVTTDENCDGNYGGPDQLTYIFDFGDGTTAQIGPANPGVTVQSPRHDYSEQTKLIQTYNVKVKAIDEHGAVSGWSNNRLVTIINKNAINAYAGMAMTVKALQTNYVYNMVPNYAIDENGNILTTDESYSVIANLDGTYDVEHDGQVIQQGLDSVESVQNYVTSGTTGVPENNNNNNEQTQGNTPNQAPHASISGPSSGSSGQSLSFSASGSSDPDGIITRYDWYYKGSWHNNIGPSISISFLTTTTTTKTVTVKIHDNDGATDTASKSVTITSSSCCFPSGTMILMADGTCKPIEQVCVGEEVMSYDTELGVFVFNNVKEIVSPLREGVYNINDGLIYPTDDHPFYTMKSDGRVGWAAIKPEKTPNGYQMKTMRLEIGDKIFTSDGLWINIKSLEYKSGVIQTYNLEDVSGQSNFFANNILVHNAASCSDESDSESSSSSSSSSGSSGSMFSTLSDSDERSNSESIDVAIRFASSVFVSDDTIDEETAYEEPTIIKNNIEENDDFSYKSIKEKIIDIIMKIIESFQLKFNAPVNIGSEEVTPEDINIELPSNEDDSINDETDLPETQDDEPADDGDEEEFNLDLIKIIWDFGDGHKGYGPNPVHIYSVDFSETSDTQEAREIYYNIPTPDDRIASIDIEEGTEEITADITPKTITYDVIMYVIYDRDNIVNEDNVEEIDIKSFEILDVDTTSVTIKQFNLKNPSLIEGVISIEGLDKLVIKTEKIYPSIDMHF